MKFIKGQSYKYSEIENAAKKAETEIEEYGHYTCGEQFLIAQIRNKTLSFVLTGTMGQEDIYECIFAN